MSQSPTNTPDVDGGRVEALPDGKITFKLLKGGAPVATAVFSQQEAAGLASHLLNAARSAQAQTGQPPPPAVQVVLDPLETDGFGAVPSKVQGRYALFVRFGIAVIGFAVDRQHLRGMGRALIELSHRDGSAVSSGRLLRDVLADFLGDLRGWGGVFSARFKAASRRRAVSFSSKISGRSLRVFRAIDIVPGMKPFSYSPIGECIYCGSKVYADVPGVRKTPLGLEHIVPEGLDGKLEIPDASCRACEGRTSRLERDVLLRTIKAIRLYLQIRGKRKSSRPKTLPLSVTDKDKERIEQIPVEDYPVILNMPMYGPPAVFRGGPGGTQTATGFHFVILRHDQKVLQAKYGITSFASPYWDTHALFRILAKIGHSFAVAELGMSRFKPLLQDMIRTDSTDHFNHIGGEPEIVKASSALHEIALGYQRANRKDYVVARVRLFANNHAPTYYAVVGESLELPIAKLSRVLSSKISLMLAR